MSSTDSEKQLEHFVIVDPYSSGIFLVEEFQKQGCRLIGIQSSQDLADFWLRQFDESLFVHTIKHESLEKTIKSLKEYNVVACVSGSEPGGYLSEDIQEELKLEKRNGAEHKDWRRHKFHQQRRLRDCGLRSIRQTFAATVEECLEWQKQWNKWPIIIKPAESGGTDGVYWCHNEEDCRVAFRNECNKLNINGAFNDHLLCQEFLDGTEYIVDCVSNEGKHVLQGIWEYEKIHDPKKRSISYLCVKLMSSTGEVQDKLTNYTFQALAALEINYGPSHSEVIIVDGEPCLVETGARMQGLKGPKMMEYATGLGVSELVVDVYAHGGHLFNELYERDYRYFIKKAAAFTFLNNTTKDGILAEDVDLRAIKNLPSVLDASIKVRKGDMLECTRDINTSPGLVIHVHPRMEQIIADTKALRMFENRDGFYLLETDLNQNDAESPLQGSDMVDQSSSESAYTTQSPQSRDSPRKTLWDDSFLNELGMTAE